MNIKPLLLGAAAVLATVPFAQAADAIVVEPEPVDYVRICDAYGDGFFFIPGTDTCINFNGYVRSSYEKTYIHGEIQGSLVGGVPAAGNTLAGTTTTGPTPAPTIDPSFTAWGQRARLGVDVRNETDWGTLRSQIRIEAGQSNTDADYDMDRALISLAGFRFGFSDNYWSTNHGFGWINLEAVSSVAFGIVYPDGFYGFDDATLADYTWASDGLAITIGAEDPRVSYGRDTFLNATNSGGTDGRVNFYAGFNYTGSGWGVAGTVVHDSLAPDVGSLLPAAGGVVTDVGGWAYKISANLDLSSVVSGGTLWGMYMYDGDYNTDYVHGNALTENPDSAWGVAFGMNLTDEVQFVANYFQLEGGIGCPASRTPVAVGGACLGAMTTAIQEGDAEQWTVGLNWYPAAAPGFQVKASYTRGSVDNSASSVVSVSPIGASFDYDNFEVSIRRDF